MLMRKDLVCEITEYMDKFRDPKQCKLEYMRTYIYSKKMVNLSSELIAMMKIMKNTIFGI